MTRPVIGVVEAFPPGDRAHVERVLADLRALGVRHLRTPVSWATWESAGGEAWYDWLLPRLAREVDILPGVHGTPPARGLAGKMNAPPRDPEAFGAFVDALIARHGTCFDHVELWNEPNNRAAWDATLDPGWVHFDEMVTHAARTAHHHGKRVVLGGMSPVDAPWLAAMCERAFMRHVDVVGVHGYPGTWEVDWPGWSALLDGVRRVLDARGVPVDVWVTETGYATWNHDERAQLARFLDTLDMPVPRVYWHSAEDRHPREAGSLGHHMDEREYHFGLRAHDGTPKLLHRLWSEGGVDAVRDAAWLTRPPRFTEDARPVLITGGAGFMGANLAHRLLTAGRPVLLLDNLSRPTARRNLRWLRDVHGSRAAVEVADVRNAAAVSRCVAQASAVFHLGAQVAVTTSLDAPRRDFEVNAAGTLNVLEAVRARGDDVPVVFSSTNKVYGGMPDVTVREAGTRVVPEDPEIAANGVDESRPLDFHSPYGCSKGAADQYVRDYARSYGLPATALRLSCTYGPHQFGTEDQGWVAHFLIRALKDAPITIYGTGRQVRDVLFVDDLVDALLAAEAHAGDLAGRAFNVGGGPHNTLSLLELLEMIGSLTGRKPETRFANWRVGDQPYYASNVHAFAAATGWRPRTRVHDGIRQLHDWLAGDLAATPRAPPMTIP